MSVRPRVVCRRGQKRPTSSAHTYLIPEKYFSATNFYELLLAQTLILCTSRLIRYQLSYVILDTRRKFEFYFYFLEMLSKKKIFCLCFVTRESVGRCTRPTVCRKSRRRPTISLKKLSGKNSKVYFNALKKYFHSLGIQRIQTFNSPFRRKMRY